VDVVLFDKEIREFLLAIIIPIRKIGLRGCLDRNTVTKITIG